MVPTLLGRILELSPESLDEETWAARLDATGTRGERSGTPSLDDIGDLLTVLAHFDGSLTLGELPLRAAWAKECLALVRDAQLRDYLVVGHTVDHFTETLAGILESLGLEDTAQTLRAEYIGLFNEQDAQEEENGLTERVEAQVRVEGGTLTAAIEVLRVYSPFLARAGVSPIVAIEVSNDSEAPVEVSTLSAGLDSDRESVWLGPEITLPAGENLRLDSHELAWHPTVPDSLGAEGGLVTDTLTVAVGAGGRSRAAHAGLAWLPEKVWVPTAPPELAAAFVLPTDPAVTAVVSRILGSGIDVEDAADSRPVLEDLFAAVESAVDEGLSVTPDPELTEGDTTTPVSPSAVRERSRASASERALFIAAVFEALRLPVALIGTASGLRVGTGHTFDAEESASIRGRSAVRAELSAMVLGSLSTVPDPGWSEDNPRPFMAEDPKPVLSAELDSAVSVVDLGTARRAIGVAAPAAAPAGTGAGAARGRGTSAGDPNEPEPRAVTRWKRELLDLSLRNPLLRMPRTGGAELVLPDIALLGFADALASGTSFALAPHTTWKGAEATTGSARTARASHLVDAMEDGVVHAKALGAGFEARLRALMADARASRDENGFTTLYVTLGALEWTDRGGQTALSPILLAPVVVGGSAKDGFTLALEPGGALQVNHCLVEKLRIETGKDEPSAALAHPAGPQGAGTGSAGRAAGGGASAVDAEYVLTRVEGELREAGVDASMLPEARLGTFTYASLPLWQDLDSHWRDLLRMPVAGHIARTPYAAFADPAPVREVVPEDETKTWLPSQADASQLDAIVSASAGRSFVLEGPPGTGKSQTITNMIADGLARGRRILFVAEKKAALDVVLGRLEEVGLGSLVLDAHGETQTLDAVREQMRAALAVKGTTEQGKLEEARMELAQCLATLRAYPESLHSGHGVWDKFQACLELEQEFDPESGWQPGEIAVDRIAASTSTEAVREVAKRVRRARRRVNGDVSEDNPAWSPAEASDATALRSALKELADLGLVQPAAQIARGRDGGQLAEAVQLAMARHALQSAVAADGVVRYKGENREELVRSYLRLSAEVEALTRRTIAGVVAGRRRWGADRKSAEAPARFVEAVHGRGAAGSGSGSGALTTLRGFFAEFGDDILSTTPCVLMSPTGVATHLPASGLEFDTVVFDEASQITTSSAIGALGRARAAVIVGDSKQMPPSADFSADGFVPEELPGETPEVGGATGAAEAEQEGAGVAGSTTAGSDSSEVDATGTEAGMPATGVNKRLESVLTNAVDAGVEQKWLKWHYRSRKEALIAFSNRKYYAGRLSSFPEPPNAAGAPDAEEALRLREFPVDLRFVGGEYTKVSGSAQKVNAQEADAVVAEVSRRMAEDPSKSLAVATFNASQQKYIEQALEAAAEKDAGVRAALDREQEPLFVKNVESLQGDERDVVLFSIGYAPDRKTGRLNQSFGPLSRAGGERRFNVAISRAREAVVIFTSLKSSDINVRNSKSRGLRDLRDYLHDAERGAVVKHQGVLDRSTLYREIIAEKLRTAGLEVETGIGTSSFVVDLAVRAPKGGAGGSEERTQGAKPAKSAVSDESAVSANPVASGASAGAGGTASGESASAAVDTEEIPVVEDGAEQADAEPSAAESSAERPSDAEPRGAETQAAAAPAEDVGTPDPRDAWVAVLLDPPSWAAMPTGWDRDGLPVSVLEDQMGWACVRRLLLADWLRDSDAAVRRIVDVAEAAATTS